MAEGGRSGRCVLSFKRNFFQVEMLELSLRNRSLKIGNILSSLWSTFLPLLSFYIAFSYYWSLSCLSTTSLNQALSPDQGNVEGRALYLLTRLNEFLNSHHAILVPVHLLQKGSQVEKTGGMTGKRQAELR